MIILTLRCRKSPTFSLSKTTSAVAVYDPFNHIAPNSTGWIGSVIWGVQMFSSPLGTFLESCFSYRPALILVIIVASAAIFVSSFAQSVQQLFVTLGAIYGLALGTSWFIMLCVIVQYYPAKNTVRAISFATLGGTIGEQNLLIFRTFHPCTHSKWCKSSISLNVKWCERPFTMLSPLFHNIIDCRMINVRCKMCLGDESDRIEETLA